MFRYILMSMFFITCCGGAWASSFEDGNPFGSIEMKEKSPSTSRLSFEKENERNKLQGKILETCPKSTFKCSIENNAGGLLPKTLENPYTHAKKGDTLVYSDFSLKVTVAPEYNPEAMLNLLDIPGHTIRVLEAIPSIRLPFESGSQSSKCTRKVYDSVAQTGIPHRFNVVQPGVFGPQDDKSRFISLYLTGTVRYKGGTDLSPGCKSTRKLLSSTTYRVDLKNLFLHDNRFVVRIMGISPAHSSKDHPFITAAIETPGRDSLVVADKEIVYGYGSVDD